MDVNNLSEHEKQMIAVAEGGDPNDPAENKDEVVNLPSEEAKDSDKDEPTADATEGDKEGPKSEEEDKGDDAEETKDDDGKEESENEELTEEQKELRKLKQEARDRKILDAIGGEEKYKELAQWAGNELNQEQLDVYNQAINSDNADVAVFAAQALDAMKQVADIQKHGYQGTVTTPNGDAGSNVPQGYESFAQMQADMSDARYATDEAYRNKVMAKVAITPEGIL